MVCKELYMVSKGIFMISGQSLGCQAGCATPVKQAVMLQCLTTSKA
jgi:hypothetical protein